jgi:hypothetical protein
MSRTAHHVALAQSTVNMSPDELDAWLATEDSRRAVEAAEEEADKEGRHIARRCVACCFRVANPRGFAASCREVLDDLAACRLFCEILLHHLHAAHVKGLLAWCLV